MCTICVRLRFHVYMWRVDTVTWVTRRRWAEAWLSAVAVGVRIRYEVGWAVDWVVDGYGIGIGHGRRQLKGGEIDRL